MRCFTLTCALVLAGSPTAFAQGVIFAAAHRIKAVSAEGGPVQTIAESTRWPNVMVVNFDIGQIFLADLGGVRRFTLDGTMHVIHQSGTFVEKTSLGVDAVAQRVYWTDFDEWCDVPVSQKPWNGPPGSEITSILNCNSQVLSVDSTSQRAFVSDSPNLSFLDHLGDVVPLSPVPQGGTLGAVVLADLEATWWIGFAGGIYRIGRTPFGGEGEILIDGIVVKPKLLQVDTVGGKIYWVEATTIRGAILTALRWSRSLSVGHCRRSSS